MQNRDFQSNYKENFLDWWNNITLVRKPILAAVNGYALGGGCEVNILKKGAKIPFLPDQMKCHMYSSGPVIAY